MKTKRQISGIRLSAAAIAAAFCLSAIAGCTSREKGTMEKYVLCGHGISEYSIIVPEAGDPCGRYAAELLRDGIGEITGTYPEITTDKSPETTCEILIGDTQRAQSRSSASLAPDEYMVYSAGTKAVLLGESYMVAGGIPDLLNVIREGKKLSSDRKECRWEPDDAQSVILLIGDGMGKNHIALAEAEDPLTAAADGGLSEPEEKGGITFAATTFPVTGSMTTLNVNGGITDSAASGTALATGHKTENGVLGMIPDDLDGDGDADELSSVQNVREAACLKGMRTGVLSTDRQTGATPNAFLVHHSDRYSSSVIIEQQAATYSTPFKIDYFDCSYDSGDFCDNVRNALETLECDEGFFFMAEEAMIDKYASRLDYDNVIRTVKRMNEAVLICATYAACHPDVAVIVTADHETGGLTVGDDGEFSWTSDGEHTDAPVGIYAMGGGTNVLSGNVDNTDVGKYIFSVIEK